MVRKELGKQRIELLLKYEENFDNMSNELVSGLPFNSDNTVNFAVFFFSVLLSLEDMETIRLFHYNREVKIRLIFIVAMIAISRKLLALITVPGKG